MFKLKYWRFEDAPLKELLKNLSIAEIAKVFFDNETQAYRFARALLLVKQKQQLKLKDCPNDLPKATWKRYLDYGVSIGILKHENQTYSFTDRFLASFKNFAFYIKEWIEKGDPNEDLQIAFPNAKTGKVKEIKQDTGNKNNIPKT
ncbi:MAG: hypothetical protein ACP5HJ_01410 [Candidatus Micrarchaeia archaeon]|jgi:hypothetical protein